MTSVELYKKFPNGIYFLCKGISTYIGVEEMCKADLRLTFLGDFIDTSTGKMTENVIRFQKKCYSLKSKSINGIGCMLCFRSFKLTTSTKPFNESDYPYYIDTDPIDRKGSIFYYRTLEEALNAWNALSNEVREASSHNLPNYPCER